MTWTSPHLNRFATMTVCRQLRSHSHQFGINITQYIEFRNIHILSIMCTRYLLGNCVSGIFCLSIRCDLCAILISNDGEQRWKCLNRNHTDSLDLLQKTRPLEQATATAFKTLLKLPQTCNVFQRYWYKQLFFYLFIFFIPTVQFTFKQKSKQININLVRPYTHYCVYDICLLLCQHGARLGIDSRTLQHYTLQDSCFRHRSGCWSTN